ncbi:hypothetical protein HK104_004454 [Borealophlyctis nickersoniae]|nr:hypothetical protein HK104_004454 [Borealophlyctis nickersoniae]
MALFTVIGIWGGRKRGQTKDVWLTARNTQDWMSLGVNFFSSGLGVWTVFALPAVGATLGVLGTIDYAVACVVPLGILCIMGPALRAQAPEGVTLTQFVLTRYGWPAQFVTNLMTIFYMSIYLISELTALAFLLETFGIDPLVPQIVVCVATLLYTAIGGMPASLLTDQFQGWIVMLLMLIAILGFSLNIRLPDNMDEGKNLISPSQPALESLYTLPVAVTAANIFHQGYWQRVYSARSNRDLYISAIFATAILLPVMGLFGVTGLIAVWANLATADTSNTAFFAITATFPAWINAIVLILGMALVASSVDTLQSGLAAIITTDIFQNKISLNYCRIGVVFINIPAVVIGLKGLDVLQLFLIADLIAAIVVLPVCFGLIKSLRTVLNGVDFIVGVVGGFIGVIGFGWVYGGSIQFGGQLLGVPHGLNATGESIGAFVAAPVGSAVFMFLSALIRRPFTTPTDPMIGAIKDHETLTLQRRRESEAITMANSDGKLGDVEAGTDAGSAAIAAKAAEAAAEAAAVLTAGGVAAAGVGVVSTTNAESEPGKDGIPVVIESTSDTASVTSSNLADLGSPVGGGKELQSPVTPAPGAQTLDRQRDEINSIIEKIYEEARAPSPLTKVDGGAESGKEDVFVEAPETLGRSVKSVGVAGEEAGAEAK